MGGGAHRSADFLSGQSNRKCEPCSTVHDERRVKMTHGEVVWLSGSSGDEKVALVVTDRSDVLRSYLQCHVAEVEVFHILAVAFRKVDDDALQSSG